MGEQGQIFFNLHFGDTVAMIVPFDVPFWGVLQKLKRELDIRYPEIDNAYINSSTWIYSGRIIINDRTLHDYNIPKDSTIHHILQLRGD